MSNVWLMTGSSRGLGRALTEVVPETGQRLVRSARQPEELSDVHANPMCTMACGKR
jgi:short-subunit dehydrogenase